MDCSMRDGNKIREVIICIKKLSRREQDPLEDSDASSTLEFETTTDPTALMAKGDRDPGSIRDYRPFMYDESVLLAAFEKRFLECPTIVVSLGILNFEDSNYSLRVCKDVQNYLGHMPESYDRNDWNTIFRKQTLEEDIELQKRFMISSRKVHNIIQIAKTFRSSS